MCGVLGNILNCPSAETCMRRRSNCLTVLKVGNEVRILSHCFLFYSLGYIAMLARHCCTLCNGTGLINNIAECPCEVMPDYVQLLPRKQWVNYFRGEEKICFYAHNGNSLITLNGKSEVFIDGKKLPWAMTPRSIEELDRLCLALKAEIYPDQPQ